MEEKKTVIIALLVSLAVVIGLFYYGQNSIGPEYSSTTLTTLKISFTPPIRKTTDQMETKTVPAYLLGNYTDSGSLGILSRDITVLPGPVYSVLEAMKTAGDMKTVQATEIGLSDNDNINFAKESGLNVNMFAAYYAISDGGNTATFLYCGEKVFYVKSDTVYFIWYKMPLSQFIGEFCNSGILIVFSDTSIEYSTITVTGTPIKVRVIDNLFSTAFSNSVQIYMPPTYPVHYTDVVVLPRKYVSGTYVFVEYGKVYTIGVPTNLPTSIEIDNLKIIFRR